MIIGYARTSTRDQQAGFDAQLVELAKAGCEKVFKEQVSAIKEREELSAALEFAREGDVFVVTKLDRLARSVPDLYSIVGVVEAKGVTLRILNIGLDTGTPTGTLMLTMLGAIAEFERSMMLERQRDGIHAAKLQGKYRGRQPTARAKSTEVLKLVSEGKTRKQVADLVGVGVASVYRILSQHRAAA